MRVEVGMTGWDDADNARRYDEFARTQPMYRETSERLVRAAGLTEGMRVVDLACGTGVTTEAVLALVGETGRVIGVDASAAMLDVAKQRVDDPRVEWACGRAEELARLVAPGADAIVCNSAIWQTAMADAFAQARAVLCDGGRFAFTTGEPFVRLAPPRPPRAKPGLGALMTAIATLDYDFVPTGPLFPLVRNPFTIESIAALLVENGFADVRHEVWERASTPDEERAWLSVPIFTERLLPGMPFPIRLEILDKAWERLDRSIESSGRWVTFVATAA